MTPTTTTATDAVALDVETDRRRRWPLRPLLDVCEVTIGELALEVGVSRDVVAIAARRGLTDAQADEWAIRVGFHPLLVWGWAWIDAAGTPDEVHERVALDLRALIEAGALAPGELLPSTKTLAAEHATSTTTVTKAVAVLAHEGLVIVRGKGLRPLVAHPTRLGCRTCGECGEPIDPGVEHYPHRPRCSQPTAGWCECDHPTHPDCCPTCATEVPA
jgi:hypothetical protein